MAKEYFPQIGKIPFEGTKSKNPMAFHYYDSEKVVMGKKMKDWLKFAMAWWHTLGGASGDQFGGQTRSYEWDKAADAVQRAKDKADAIEAAAVQKVQDVLSFINDAKEQVLSIRTFDELNEKAEELNKLIEPITSASEAIIAKVVALSQEAAGIKPATTEE